MSPQEGRAPSDPADTELKDLSGLPELTDVPLVLVAVGLMLQRPGSRQNIAVSMEFSGGFAANVDSSVAQKLSGELIVESIAEGFTATGDLVLAWEGVCRRCLDPVTEPLDLPVSEMYEREPVEGETYAIDADDVNLAPMLREVALLVLPLAPLCSENCPGPAPEQFPTGPPEELEQPAGDPRWAALDQLVFDPNDHVPDGDQQP